MSALSKYLSVIFLDGTTEFRRRVTYARPDDNVTVVRGLVSMLLALQRRGMEWLAPMVANRALSRVLRPFRRIIFWNAENWARPHRYIRHDALVYDCIDPAFTEDPVEVRAYDQRELGMLAASARVFASADSLYDRCKRHHGHVTLLNNACEPSDYDEALVTDAAKPAWWPETDKPVAAYLGSLDWRLDFDCIERACRENSSLQFVLAGNVLPQFTARIGDLQKLPNVTCPGRITVRDGRFLLGRCSLGLIPFIQGEMNDAVNPVKMYAYALLGKPIVGTATRELVGRPGIVLSAPSPGHFSAAIGEALKRSRQPEAVGTLKRFALENTWKDRADQAWQVISELVETA